MVGPRNQLGVYSQDVAVDDDFAVGAIQRDPY